MNYREYEETQSALLQIADKLSSASEKSENYHHCRYLEKAIEDIDKAIRWLVLAGEERFGD